MSNEGSLLLVVVLYVQFWSQYTSDLVFFTSIFQKMILNSVHTINRPIFWGVRNSGIGAVTKLSNIATVLWQWKRELEYESKKHCRDSINNSYTSINLKIGLYSQFLINSFSGPGGSDG